MTRIRTFIALVALGLVTSGVPAHSQTPDAPYVTTEAYNYIPGDVHLSLDLTFTQGETLQYVNLDPVGGFHTITAEDVDKQGNPIFDTGAIPVPPGSLAAVKGTESLQPGTYFFYCTVHGASEMEGKFTVLAKS